jgi:hypothetical protein
MTCRFHSRLVAVGFGGLAALTGGLTAAEKKDDEVRRDAENLQRYDRNANGKLDPDEIAAMKADQAREKSREQSRDKEKEKSPKKG